jgi:hypothetical protein
MMKKHNSHTNDANTAHLCQAEGMETKCQTGFCREGEI